MTRGRIVLIVAVVVVCLVFFGGIGVGLTHSSDKSTHQSWTDTLGNLLIQPATAGDLSPSPAGCLSGNKLFIPAFGTCTYKLTTGFLGRKLRLKLDTGVGANITLTQGNIPPQTKNVTGEVSVNYNASPSVLTIACLSFTGTCMLEVE